MGNKANKRSYEFRQICHDECVDSITAICNHTLAPKFLKNINTKIFINEVKDGEKQNAGSIRLTFFDIFSDKTKQFGFKAVFPSGKVLACLGDEPFNEKCRNFVQNCDYLMCEAFCLYSQILYHTEDETLQTRKSTYTSEARTVFNGNIFVPDDFEVIDLK